LDTLDINKEYNQSGQRSQDLNVNKLYWFL